MDWFKKHTDTLAVLTIVVGAAIWMNNSIHNLSQEMDNRFVAIEKDLAIVKTILVMRGIMPIEFAAKTEEGK